MADIGKAGLVDLSHVIEDGMVTYQGLPGPHICDYWTREGSAANYDDGSSFQIGRIDMIANTGTYLDTPFHRYADGKDLAGLRLESLADLPGIVVRRPHAHGIATDASDLEGLDVAGQAVLIHTGWSAYWRTDAYAVDQPFVTAAAADWLVEHGAALVGIDSYNIDDVRVRARPVHSRLLAADIPICEHMRGLEQLPDSGFRFSAVPPKIAGMGTFPVRAYALIDA
ncbi:MAG: cyclase family protein [Sphingomicrobium sp.]